MRTGINPEFVTQYVHILRAVGNTENGALLVTSYHNINTSLVAFKQNLTGQM
jgi:hypothetical protein